MACDPAALIVLCRVHIHPSYTPLYLSFTATALALVLGLRCPWPLARISAASRRPFLSRRGAEMISGATKPVRTYGMDYHAKWPI